MIKKNKKPNGYWTYDRCKKIVSKCKSKKELREKYNTVYSIIFKNKWVNLISVFPSQQKRVTYWTYDKCKKIALKYKSRKEMAKKNMTAYIMICKNKWYELIMHLKLAIKASGYWTYDKCKEIALLCKNNKELRENYSTAYTVICKNKWHELTVHFYTLNKPYKYWTYDRCKEIALLCKNKKELREKYITAYGLINKNKWYELYSHMELVGNKYKRLIYIYEFSDNHVYVGLTCNIKKRNEYHKLIGPVYKHSQKSGLIPIFTYGEYIDVNDAVVLEGTTVQKYKDNGWIILNTAKTGGLGGGKLLWTKDKCKKEAEKYITLSDFRKNSPQAYDSSLRHGWFDEIGNHLKRTRMKYNYWQNKENCMNESKKYNTRIEFRKKSEVAYKSSSKNGWLNDFYPKAVK